MKTAPLSRGLLAAVTLALLSGCAGIQERDAAARDLEARIQRAQQTADLALRTAREAQATAQTADRKAEASMDAANTAQAAADDASERASRIVRKAMMK